VKAAEQSGDLPLVDPAVEIAQLQGRLARLSAARAYAAVHAAKESVAAKKRERERLISSGSKKDRSAAENLAKQIAREEKELLRLNGEFEKLKSAAVDAPANRQAKL
jgi:hypothetical protein